MLSITGDHATRVDDLGKHPSDPFDRLLVAQAQVDKYSIFRAYDLPDHACPRLSEIVI
jgi:PIN domain nuclease of toxin-antitoxin system